MDSKTEQFKVGSYYRNGFGEVVQLIAHPDWAREGFPFASIPAGADPEKGARAAHRLSDGRTSTGKDEYALIPGECDEQGNPIPQFFVTAATMKAEDEPNPDEMTFEQLMADLAPPEPEKIRDSLTWNKRPILDRWPGFVTHRRMPDVQTAPVHPTQRLAEANAQIDPGHAMAAVRQLVR